MYPLRITKQTQVNVHVTYYYYKDVNQIIGY